MIFRFLDERVSVFNFDINVVQYGIINSRIALHKKLADEGILRYSELTNNSCSGTAYDIFNNITTINFKKSKVKVPAKYQATTDKLKATVNGITRYEIANPYSMYNGLMDQGYEPHGLKFANIHISTLIGKTDPLLTVYGL